MNDEFTGEVFHLFPTKDRESVWAYTQDYRGQKLAHIRIFAADKDDVDRPTKRGIAVGLDHLPELVAAVQALAAALEVDDD